MRCHVSGCNCGRTNGQAPIGQAADSTPQTCPASATGTSRWRRVSEPLSWLFPSLVLALMPKCPACVAAYVGLGTGIGLSFSTAATLQKGLILGSVAALGFLTVRLLLRRRSQAAL